MADGPKQSKQKRERWPGTHKPRYAAFAQPRLAHKGGTNCSKMVPRADSIMIELVLTPHCCQDGQGTQDAQSDAYRSSNDTNRRPKKSKVGPKVRQLRARSLQKATKSKALSPNDCERILKDLVKIRSAHYFATSSHMQTDRICMNGPHFHSLENALNTCNAIALGGPS